MREQVRRVFLVFVVVTGMLLLVMVSLLLVILFVYDGHENAPVLSRVSDIFLAICMFAVPFMILVSNVAQNYREPREPYWLDIELKRLRELPTEQQSDAVLALMRRLVAEGKRPLAVDILFFIDGDETISVPDPRQHELVALQAFMDFTEEECAAVDRELRNSSVWFTLDEVGEERVRRYLANTRPGNRVDVLMCCAWLGEKADPARAEEAMRGLIADDAPHIPRLGCGGHLLILQALVCLRHVFSLRTYVPLLLKKGMPTDAMLDYLCLMHDQLPSQETSSLLREFFRLMLDDWEPEKAARAWKMEVGREADAIFWESALQQYLIDQSAFPLLAPGLTKLENAIAFVRSKLSPS